MMKQGFYADIPPDTLAKYFGILVGKVFKILPLAEDSSVSAKIYLDGFHRELQGINELFNVINQDPTFVSLLGTIMWLTQHVTDRDCTIEIIKREVFSAISLCQDIKSHFLPNSEMGGDP